MVCHMVIFVILQQYVWIYCYNNLLIIVMVIIGSLTINLISNWVVYGFNAISYGNQGDFQLG